MFEAETKAEILKRLISYFDDVKKTDVSAVEGTFAYDTLAANAKEFEKTYNIKVNMETFDDMEAMYSKVKSGAGKYDVILVSDALMPNNLKKHIQKWNS